MNIFKFVLNIALTIVFLLLMDPRSFYGLSFHEWAGLIIVIFFLLHKVINWVWIKKVTVGFFRPRAGRSRLNYILDVLLLAGLTLITLSGLAIARTIDFSWLNIGGSHNFWRIMHTSSSLITLALFGIHLGLHWKWVLCVMRLRKTENGKEN
jgi:predicted ferric reductase